jgi:hypothetical protein
VCSIRCEASRHFSNEKKEYLEVQVNKPVMNSKNKNINCLYIQINDSKKDYQPRSNVVKDESGDLLADSVNILNR